MDKLYYALTIPTKIEFFSNLLFISLACLVLVLIVFKLLTECNLLTSIIYLSLFSLVLCIIYLLLDAPDVAMTEAAIGVCLSTIILLLLLTTLTPHFSSNSKNKLISLIVCMSLTYCLLMVGEGLYEYGSSNTPLHQHIVSRHYIEKSGEEIGINSVVAAILASYRGFDTLGETLVIFAAGLIVTLILSYRRKNVE